MYGVLVTRRAILDGKIAIPRTARRLLAEFTGFRGTLKSKTATDKQFPLASAVRWRRWYRATWTAVPTPVRKNRLPRGKDTLPISAAAPSGLSTARIVAIVFLVGPAGLEPATCRSWSGWFLRLLTVDHDCQQAS